MKWTSTSFAMMVILGVTAKVWTLPTPTAVEEKTKALVVEGIRQLEALSAATHALYEKALPSVVNIYTFDENPGVFRLPMEGKHGPFFFFGEDEKKNPKDKGKSHPPTAQDREAVWPSSQGSGIVVDQQGWILTNNHVLGESNKILLEWSNGVHVELSVNETEGDAQRSVWRDKRSDLALVKVPLEQLKGVDLTTAEFGDSDRLLVGAPVFALGSPLGRDKTLTQGIISQTGRQDVLPLESQDEIRYENLIQTTAFINPGNSGGPLLDLHGKVVGINVAIQTTGNLSQTSGFVGVGFAIPSNRAKMVADQLIKTGRVIRGWLGVKIENVSPDFVEASGMNPVQGVVIVDVLPNTPAARGGLKKRDVIVSFNDQKITDVGQLMDLVAGAPVDGTVRMGIFRDNERTTINLQIAEQPDRVTVSAPEEEETPAQDNETYQTLGLTVENMESETAKKLGFKSSERGVLVTRVEPNSRAAREGLRRQMLITHVGKTRVENLDNFRQALQTLRDQANNKVLLWFAYVEDERTSSNYVVLPLTE